MIIKKLVIIQKVLTSLQKQGHYLMIATGRPYRASQIYYHELNMNTPIVNFNGAMFIIQKQMTLKPNMRY